MGCSQIKALPEHINNNLSEAGKVPEGRNHAEIITIPKHRKKPSLEVFRMSGPQQVSKSHSRQQPLPAHAMLGFQAGLLTQGAYLLLKDEVLLSIPGGEEHPIVALDLKGAITHIAILNELDDQLNDLQCGKNIFN